MMADASPMPDIQRSMDTYYYYYDYYRYFCHYL